MKTKMIFKKVREGGFTLVELLIVIALIAILSVAVLATINPIEQTNKARDAKFKNDTAEVLSAYERYYASQNSYPWGTPETIGSTIIVSNSPNFGVVGDVGTSYGVLITTSELKSSFADKEQFSNTTAPIDKIYVYNNGSDSNYVCFVPKAKANRAKLGELRCLSSGNGLLNPGDSGCASIPEDSPSWNTGTGGVTDYMDSGNANFMCVPDSANVKIGGASPTVSP